MTSLLRIPGQVLAYAAFMAFIGYFASAPPIRTADPDQAQILLSFSHGGERVTPCRRFTQEELNQLAPNMRRPQDCPRGRVPVAVELELDGQPLFSTLAPPTGLSGDGPSAVYHHFVVAPGRHTLTARLRDSRRRDGFDYEHRAEINLVPRQNYVIDFRADKGGFLFDPEGT
jgi:hypothetical protein